MDGWNIGVNVWTGEWIVEDSVWYCASFGTLPLDCFVCLSSGHNQAFYCLGLCDVCVVICEQCCQSVPFHSAVRLVGLI